MAMTIVIFVTVMMGGTPQTIEMPTTYETMAACEAAKAQVVERYGKEHPDAEIAKSECMEKKP